MCGPAIGIVGSLVGGVVSAMGSIYQGNLQSAQYKAQAQADKFAAQAERMSGIYEAQRLEDKGNRLTGDQVVGFGNEGLELSGSALDVIADSATEVALDKASIRVNADNRAKVNDYEAKVAEMNAKAAKQAGQIGAVSAIVGGIASAAGSFSGFGGSGSSVGSPFTKGVAPTGLGTPIPAAKPVAAVAPRGNIPIYGYSYYGGPR